MKHHHFAIYPVGGPGLGLLVLRLALAAAAVGLGAPRVAAMWQGASAGLVIALGIAGALWIVAAVFIACGMFTGRVAMGVALIEPVMMLVRLAVVGSGADAMGAAPDHLLETAIAIGLGLVGPGAYSVDARVFGRREIIIPPRAKEFR